MASRLVGVLMFASSLRLTAFSVLILIFTLNSAASTQGPLAPGSVDVTPDGASEPIRQANTGGYAAYFTVKNNYLSSQTYQLTCFGHNNVTCTAIQPGQVTLGPGQSTEPGDVFATY